jgi:hypothetical protein
MSDAEFANCLKRLDAVRSGESLPEPDAIWWRAELRRKMVFEERATRPIRIVEQLACAVFLLAVVILSAVR